MRKIRRKVQPPARDVDVYYIAGMTLMAGSIAMLFIMNDDRWFTLGYPVGLLVTVLPMIVRWIRRVRRRRTAWRL